jgi:hypothetical protein
VTVERPHTFRAHRDLDRVLGRGGRFYLRQGPRRLPYRLERRVGRWLRRAGLRRRRRGRRAPAGGGRPSAASDFSAGAGLPPALRGQTLGQISRRSRSRGLRFPTLGRRSYPGLASGRRPSPPRLHPSGRRGWRGLTSRAPAAWAALLRHRRLRHRLFAPAPAAPAPTLALDQPFTSLARTLGARRRALVAEARRRRLRRRAASRARPLGRFLERRRAWPLRSLALLEQRRGLRGRRRNPLLTATPETLGRALATGERRLRRRAWPLFRQLLRHH